MLDNVASVVLVFLAVVVLLQVFKGTLGSWVRAKFLNQAS